MQREKASRAECVDPPAFDEPLERVDDGLPLQAAVSRSRPTVATMAAEGIGFIRAGLRPNG
jgi:hypothetical protein